MNDRGFGRFLEERRGWAVILLMAMSVGAFIGTMDAGFVWDDVLLVEQLAQTGRNGHFLSVFSEEFKLRSSIGYYRPMVKLSLFFDRFLYGSNAGGFHATNIAFHCMTTLLFLLLVYTWTDAWVLSCLSAAVFAVHPAHAESVAFLAARSDLLAALFIAASGVLWQLSSRRAKPLALFAASALCWFVSLLCKEVALVFPFVLLFFDTPGIFPSLKNRALKKAATAALFSAGPLLAYACLRFGVAGAALGRMGREAGGTAAGSGSLAFQAMKKFYLYMKILVFPIPSRSWYSQATLDASFSWLGAGLILVGLFLFVYCGRKIFLYGAVAWIFIFLAPVVGWIPISGAVAAERFLYVPSMGYCFLAGFLFHRILERFKVVTLVALCFFLAVSFARSAQRAEIWKNDETLVRDIVRSAPDSPFGWGNLGYLQLQKGQPAEAVTSLSRALNINPSLTRSRLHLGLSYFTLSRWTDAIRHLTLAVDSRDFGGAEMFLLYRSLGISHAKVGQCGKAMEYLSKAMALSPGDEDVKGYLTECEKTVKAATSGRDRGIQER